MIANKLKVYCDTYDFVKLLCPLSTKMPRIYRYTLGERIMDNAFELLDYIQLANMYKDKRKEYLEVFVVRFEMIHTQLRLAFDLRAIQGKSRQVEIFLKMDKIGKQITAWKNSDSTRHRKDTNDSESL